MIKQWSTITTHLTPFGVTPVQSTARKTVVAIHVHFTTPNTRLHVWATKKANFLSYFFVKKIPLSRRVGYVMDGSMG